MVILMGGYRVVGNFVNIELLSDPDFFKFATWHFTIPPFWLGYLMKSIILWDFNINSMVFAILMIVVPLASLNIISSDLVNKFASKLGNIDVSTKSLELKRNKKVYLSGLGKYYCKIQFPEPVSNLYGRFPLVTGNSNSEAILH